MKTTAKNKGLKNPAAAIAASPAGERAIETSLQTSAETTRAGVSLAVWAIKWALILGVGYYVIRSFQKRFVKAAYNPNLPAANVSDAVASAKANALYEAMYGASNDLQSVAAQLAGLNYNGWIKVYNAFGNRQPFNPFADEMNLIEWISDQFGSDTDEIAQLRMILPGVGF